MKNMCDLISSDKRYYIYGTAMFAQYCYSKITESFGDDIVIGFIETVPKFKKFCSKEIITVNEADNNACVIITGFASEDKMRNILLEAGFNKENIISFPHYRSWFARNDENKIQQVCFWPPIESFNKDLIDKISWFLPDRISVKVWTSNQEIISLFNENVEICNIKDKKDVFGKSDCICLWDMSIDDDIIYNDKIIIVDSSFFHAVDIANWGRLYYRSFKDSECKQIVNHSSTVYSKLINTTLKYSVANVFCSGPSIDEVDFDKYREDFNIICNSMVKDKHSMEKLKPNLITFIDNAFYFSPNKYCEKFYSDLIDMVNTYDIYIAVLDYQVPLMRRHFPELYDRIIGLSAVFIGTPIFVDKNELLVNKSENICTQIMIPIASTLFDKIQIFGCTGRDENKKYLWNYSDRFQYIDLIDCIYESYPAFKRDAGYSDYYERHCEYMQQIIEYGESFKKKYINITTSFIPALRDRTVDEKIN